MKYLIVNCIFMLLASSNALGAEQAPQQANSDQVVAELKALRKIVEQQKADLDSIKKSSEENDSFTKPKPSTVVALGAVLVSLGSLGFTLHQLNVTRKDQEQSRRESLFYDSLKWFEGGTQKRSIGIAIIEAHWDKHQEFRELWVSELSNQAIYVLTKLRQEKSLALHEANNLQRIIDLLKDDRLPQYQQKQICEIYSELNKDNDIDMNSIFIPENLPSWVQQLQCTVAI